MKSNVPISIQNIMANIPKPPIIDMYSFSLLGTTYRRLLWIAMRDQS